MIDEGLRTLLLAQAGITALVPSQTVNRVTVPSIFVDNAEQGAEPPYVVITITDGDAMLTLDGTYHDTLREAEVDIDCFSYDRTEAATINTTIRQFLDDYSGAAGASDTIKAVLHDTPVPGYDYPAEGADTKFYYMTTTYTIQYTSP